MVRMVIVRSLVMTGLAFTMGLLLGLCLHLPGISSPGREHLLLRSPREVREATGGGDLGEAPPALRRIQSTRNISRQDTVSPGIKVDPVRKVGDKSPILVGNHKQRLQDKVRAIEATYASIAAVKSGQVGLEEVEQKLKIQQKRKSPYLNNIDKKESAASKSGESNQAQVPKAIQQQNYLSASNRRGIFHPAKDQKAKVDPAVDDTPVYGSRTVTVLVTGSEEGLVDPQGTRQDVVNEHKSVQRPQTPSKTMAPSMGALGDRDARNRRLGDVTGVRQEDFRSLDDLVTGGIYWSPKVELLVPTGFTDDQVSQWRQTLDRTKVVRIEEGCGRMQNRRLTLEDGRQACARYRVNTDQMQGEIYSYYLSRLLGIRNLPPTVLASADPGSDPRWSAVDGAVTRAQWSREKPVILTPYMDALNPAYIPRELRQPSRRDNTGNIDMKYNLHPSEFLLANRTSEQFAELVQWSDLIILDFLTANVDRVVNNMFNLQWNTEMMSSPAHNLESRPSDGLLVFLDNESGLFHSYRLLDKYSHYHDTLLGALCVFRESTAKALKSLHKDGSIGRKLLDIYKREEPRSWLLPPMPESNQKILEERISQVVDQINRCESRYSNRDFS